MIILCRPGMVIHTILLLFSSGLPTQVGACGPHIVIPITNVSLPNGQSRRGLHLEIGKPKQDFAFLPQWAKNNTYVYSSTSPQCPANTSNDACITYRGGLFNTDASTSKANKSVDEAGADPSDVLNGLRGNFVATNSTLMVFLTDELRLNANTSLRNYPVGLPNDDIGQQQAEPQAILGLGQNSTILSALKSAGQIASRSYGFFYGLTGLTTSAQLDGSLVLGGYDRAKTFGPNVTSPLTDVAQCRSQMMVTVTGISLNWPNRTNSQMFSREGDAFRACLIPDYPLVMSLPSEVFQRINSNFDASFVGRSNGINFWGVAYDGAGGAPYDGDLTARIEVAGQSLDVRIPNDQLVLPDITIADDGALAANYSKQVVMLDALSAETENLLPIIGRSFLSSAYVFVNQDQGTFTLWSANASTATDVVTVDEEGAQVSSSCAVNNTNPINYDAGATSGSAGSVLSKGAIAGIAVGGVSLLGLFGFVLFRCLKRRAGTGVTLPEKDSSVYAHYQHLGTLKEPQEMPGYRELQEIDGAERGRFELGTSALRYEMAADAPMSELSGVKTLRTETRIDP